MSEKEVIGMSLEIAIKILNYNGPVFSKERIKLDTPEALFEASYRMIGGLNR